VKIWCQSKNAEDSEARKLMNNPKTGSVDENATEMKGKGEDKGPSAQLGVVAIMKLQTRYILRCQSCL